MRNPSARPDILSRTPWLLGIGKGLSAVYNEVKQPMPERLAAFVRKLETARPASSQKRSRGLARRAAQPQPTMQQQQQIQRKKEE